MEENERQWFHKKGKRRYQYDDINTSLSFFMNRWMYICGFQISIRDNKELRTIWQVREGGYKNGSYFYPVYKVEDNIAPGHMVLRKL